MTHIGQAVDDVRKREHRALAAVGDNTLSGSKYLWLYAEENLPEQHRARFVQLKALTLKTGRARALALHPRRLGRRPDLLRPPLWRPRPRPSYRRNARKNQERKPL